MAVVPISCRFGYASFDGLRAGWTVKAGVRGGEKYLNISQKKVAYSVKGYIMAVRA